MPCSAGFALFARQHERTAFLVDIHKYRGVFSNPFSERICRGATDLIPSVTLIAASHEVLTKLRQQKLAVWISATKSR
jgi:hypothetical protein